MHRDVVDGRADIGRFASAPHLGLQHHAPLELEVAGHQAAQLVQLSGLHFGEKAHRPLVDAQHRDAVGRGQVGRFQEGAVAAHRNGKIGLPEAQALLGANHRKPPVKVCRLLIHPNTRSPLEKQGGNLTREGQPRILDGARVDGHFHIGLLYFAASSAACADCTSPAISGCGPAGTPFCSQQRNSMLPSGPLMGE